MTFVAFLIFLCSIAVSIFFAFFLVACIFVCDDTVVCIFKLCVPSNVQYLCVSACASEKIELWHSSAAVSYVYCCSMNFNIGKEDDILIFRKTVENSTRMLLMQLPLVSRCVCVCFRYRKMQVSEWLLIWCIWRMSACAPTRICSRIFKHFPKRKSFASHPNWLMCCKLRICISFSFFLSFFSKCGSLQCTALLAAFRFISSLFFQLNDFKHSVHLMTWYFEHTVCVCLQTKKQDDSFGDPLFVCLVKLFISSAQFHYNSSNSLQLCVIRPFLV